MQKLLMLDSGCYDIKITIFYTKMSMDTKSGSIFPFREEQKISYSLSDFDEKKIKNIYDNYKYIAEGIELSFKCSSR